jgi:benzoyl-CoA reductase/2-hydroxyglutaryl-CoA dehydratase subunit BcrC/BadD/HgdB
MANDEGLLKYQPRGMKERVEAENRVEKEIRVHYAPSKPDSLGIRHHVEEITPEDKQRMLAQVKQELRQRRKEGLKKAVDWTKCRLVTIENGTVYVKKR